MKQLAVQELVKVYHRKAVVNRVSLQLTQGEIVGLLGPNGAGKTTTFYMIVGLTRPNQGRILFDGEDIRELPMYQRARKGINYLPQEPSVFTKLTVAENIMAILETLDLTSQEREGRLESLLKELKLSHLARNKAYSLSGGERRRVEITRALVTAPQIMLLDEPFAGIDPLAINDIQNIIRQLKEKNIGILISDHNVRETLSVCDRAYILNQGVILQEGSPEELAESELAKKIYLGEKFRLN
jgi:lipopolysaccharide export system ATP-binding protein